MDLTDVLATRTEIVILPASLTNVKSMQAHRQFEAQTTNEENFISCTRYKILVQFRTTYYFQNNANFESIILGENGANLAS